MGIFKKTYIAGLDIGSSSIKLVQFIEKEDGLHLVKADLKELKRTDDDIIGETEVVSALRYLFRDIDIKKSKIIININCPQTTIKKILTPYMPKSELREGIRLEGKNYFPFSIDESLLDFEILGDVVEKGVRKYEVIVAVSPKKTVDKYLSLLRKGDIKPDSLVSASYSLQKIAKNSVTDANETKCFIDIGKLHTELIILKGKHLMFTRKIPVAGNDFTKALTGILVSDRDRMQLSLDEAEKIKRGIGIPSETDSKIIENKISAIQVLSVLRAPLEQLINEIDRCFDYYSEETGGGEIDSLVLFGGGASLGGLIKFLSDGLGIEVKLGDPLEGLILEKDTTRERDKISHRLESAIGAVLGGTRGINLLPPEIKEKTRRVIKRGTVEAMVTAVILIFVFLYIGMKIQLNNFQKRIAVAKLELSSLRPQLKRAEAQILANSLLVNEPEWEDIFKELSDLTPDAIHLTDFTMKDNVITMKGIVASEDGEQILADFILTLEKGMFDNVKLVESRTLGEKKGIEFKLKCRVDYE